MNLNRRSLLNIGLLVLVVALGLLAWLRPGLKSPPIQPALVNLKAADIHDIKIARPGSAAITLQRAQADDWHMTAPQTINADSFLIRTLLDSLSSPTISHFKAEATKLDQYGLKQPKLQLWLNDTELDFGATEPLAGHRYVKVGDSVYLTNGTLYYRLNHDEYWWMDKQLLPAGAHITALQLPDATLTLKDGKWQLAPANPAISADAIQKLVDAWHDARALAILAPEKDKAKGEVALQLAGQKQALRFQILDNPDFLLLVRPDLKLEYRLEKNQDDNLLQLHAAPPAKPTSGHNTSEKKVTPDARTAGSRNHPSRH